MSAAGILKRKLIMVSLNFQPQFEPKILSGEKNCTIRATTIAKPGVNLQLYTGMRTRKCRKICDAVCISTQPIKITENHITINYDTAPTENSNLYKNDGFENQQEMIKFFKKLYGLPFYGILITWKI
jgi:hypothetical protein